MDKLMSSLEQSDDAQRTEMLQKLEKIQLKDTLRIFNNLVEKSFF